MCCVQYSFEDLWRLPAGRLDLGLRDLCTVGIKLGSEVCFRSSNLIMTQGSIDIHYGQEVRGASGSNLSGDSLFQSPHNQTCL